MMVSDHTGHIVGMIAVGYGWWETNPAGSRCVARVEVSVADALFSTFAAANVYTRVFYGCLSGSLRH